MERFCVCDGTIIRVVYGCPGVAITAIIFVPSKISRKKRVVIGVLHVSAHLMAALILMLMLELGIEICIQHNLLANSGQSPFTIY